ncbi:MAG: hypothetical protein QM786_06820 [Breznakibacter sp.]
MLLRRFFLGLILCGLLTLPYHVKAQTDDTNSAEQLLQKINALQAQYQRKIDAAFTAMEAVQKAGAYVESLGDLFEDGIVTLPVGIKKGDYELVIQQIKHDKESGRARIYATCAFKFKESGQPIAFEGNFTIEGQKGLGTSGQLGLIAPVARNLGDQATVIFNTGTSANFGCEGIESFYADIKVVLTSSLLTPVDAKGKPTGGSLTADIKTAFTDFDNFTASFGFNRSFAIKGLDDMVFSLNGATLDQSDTATPVTAQFPSNYFTTEQATESRNLWKGIATSEASVSLPAIFKKPDMANDTTQTEIDSRITLKLQNVLWDENGFSASVDAQNIYSSEVIDKTKWDMTVTDFHLELLKNQVVGMGFGGDLNLPPFGKNSLVPYSASYNKATEACEFKVGLTGQYEFPTLCSTLKLNEASTIELTFKDGGIYPSVDASGTLSIDAPLGSDDSKRLSIPGIAFQHMRISREAPYFSPGTIALTSNIQSPQLAGFELSLTDILTFDDANGAGLSLNAEVKLSDVFAGTTSLRLYGDYSKWKFKQVQINEIHVDFRSSAYSVNGGVLFKNGDATYGTGFRGDLSFKIIDKFSFDAVGVFGKKENYRYFLTDVFFEVPPTSGLIIPPALSFYGVGGGIYRRMQQASSASGDSDFGKSLSGINYVPDKTVGMGFMASTKFSLAAASTAFNAKVGFEMQFNDHGGLNFIQFRGDASIMDDPVKWGKLADNINTQVKKLENTGGKIQPVAKNDLSVPENINNGFLTASLNIRYDLANSTFNADINSYLNAGFIKGVGENNRMGWASAFFSPDKWYMYMGTPSDKLGIEILSLARAQSYFMLGDDIPELPAPPDKVLRNFSKEKQDKLNKRDNSFLSSGSGIAFGQSLDVQFDAKLPPFYAHLGIGMGTEFLLKKYSENAYCAGSSTSLGINQWYAQAQAWAWVEADIGMEAKIFTKRRKFSILDLSAAALLQGAGPNPFYFAGTVGGRFSVMGGLVKGKCDFDFEIGKECKIMGGSPFGEDVIAQLTPIDGDSDINVFAAPQALLNIPVGLEMEVEEDSGSKGLYKITLEEFKVTYKENGKPVTGNTEVSQDGKVIVLDPAEPFESQKEMVVYAKVGFKRKLNGKWIDVPGEDGKPVFEVKEATFMSGERPKTILPEHVKCSYPLLRQYNYYPKEYHYGYIQVTKNYSYLFDSEKPEGYRQTMVLTDTKGSRQETNFTVSNHPQNEAVRMEIDFPTDRLHFDHDEIYRLAIVNVPISTNELASNVNSSTSNLSGNDSVQVETIQADGTLNLLEEKEIYGLHFRTSWFDTFAEKIASMSNSQGIKWQEYPHVHLVGSNIYENRTKPEMFDLYEVSQPDPADNLVMAVPVYNRTNWYNTSIAPLVYGHNTALAVAHLGSFEPPAHAEVIPIAVDHAVELTEDHVKTNTRPYVSPLAAYNFRASYYVDRDFVRLQNAVANKLASTEGNAQLAEFLWLTHVPEIDKGQYPVKLEYMLPGKRTVTSSVEKTINVN